ncbi:MAG TPA: hypothetical protein PK916_11910 [Bacteroidota bacterium]|nr:hypothetical protein [Bacteroidota bacterium]
MRPRLSLLLPLLALLLQSCATHTIVLPVTRPALVDVHDCDALLLPPIDVPARHAAIFPSHDLASLFQNTLAATFASDGASLPPVLVSENGSTLFADDGAISGSALALLRREAQASCAMALRVLHTRWDEQVLSADVRDNAGVVAVRHVRMAKVELRLLLAMLDLRNASLRTVDTLLLTHSAETHATDGPPAAIDTVSLLHGMAESFAQDMLLHLRPRSDQEVVTFLADDAQPEIERSIALAMEGKWKDAIAVLAPVAEQAGNSENADVLWFDLALLQQYAGDYRAALTSLQRAQRIRDSGRYRAAIERLHAAEREALERARQGLR